MPTITIRTKKKKQIVDITEDINRLLKKELDSGSAAGMTTGLVHVFVKHTTCAITTADLDPGTDLDMLEAFEEIVPKLNYRHPHNPGHVGDHIMSAIIGPDVTVPITNGELDLGTWQRVVLVELDGPRNREVVVSIIASEAKQSV
ncbi:MAG: hypothetical protein COT92_00855 [Candidatus Doudnabacteria bacterium CG10_big_fil_rev_8_21_14_0_10_42_18]|uniref:Secondary thiamine-phosphate synthase enzyme n=1 Tax=Candidatus Doudnabacteria bacterium CG10_big_fil_rev_8_21_14_0_10_42_18 TaxID=1974552 RepID=A0A2H0VBM8_9BACT|nr:MAG: hypothetical protein COT92_00855 [Candidatus Doudnabacteria bacterium CG10_big_fil_rev_8_21_14_0_10_42_18]